MVTQSSKAEIGKRCHHLTSHVITIKWKNLLPIAKFNNFQPTKPGSIAIFDLAVRVIYPHKLRSGLPLLWLALGIEVVCSTTRQKETSGEKTVALLIL